MARGLAAAFCSLVAAVAGASRASADITDKGFVMPPLPPEASKVILPADEVKRRQTAASTQVMGEKWFKVGERGFKAHCSGCHPIGLNRGNQELLLSTENIGRSVYNTNERMQYIIRYGSSQMPGFAADCADEGEYAQCQSTIPLGEGRLRDIQDYVMNRATSGWKDLN